MNSNLLKDKELDQKNNRMDLPIFLIHGIGASSITLWPLEKYLNYKGFKNVFKIDYPVNKMTFLDSVNYVDAEIDKLVNKKKDKVILIGQSMGGVISNELHKKGWKIEKAIYIVAPLNGAHLLNKLKNKLPEKIANFMHKAPYDHLMKEEKAVEPPHDYHTIGVSWPFMDFDGCVYKKEMILDKKKHSHLRWLDHRTAFISIRLWMEVYNQLRHQTT
jgi:pimeloyl-ACP methyl ester carboxylesterase